MSKLDDVLSVIEDMSTAIDLAMAEMGFLGAVMSGEVWGDRQSPTHVVYVWEWAIREPTPDDMDLILCYLGLPPGTEISHQPGGSVVFFKVPLPLPGSGPVPLKRDLLWTEAVTLEDVSLLVRPLRADSVEF